MYQYELIDAGKLLLYKNLILNDVYEMLEDYDDFMESPFVCLGAYDEDGSVAAAVFDVSAVEELSLVSIMVSPDHRRQGIASELINRMNAVLAYDYSAKENAEDEYDLIFSTIYSLPEESDQAFEAFLESIGVEETLLLPNIYHYKMEDLRKYENISWAFDEDKMPPVMVVRLNEMPVEVELALRDSFDANLDNECSYLAQVDEDDYCYAIAGEVSVGKYLIRFFPDVCSGVTMLGSLGMTVRAISSESPDAELVIPVSTEEIDTILSNSGLIPSSIQAQKRAISNLHFTRKEQ